MKINIFPRFDALYLDKNKNKNGKIMKIYPKKMQKKTNENKIIY